jgi:hypothetical protein
MNAQRVKLLLCFLLFRAVSTAVIATKKDVIESNGDRVGQIKYHYENTAQLRHCSFALVVGVGTSMGVDDYDNIARLITEGTSIVVITVNHEVGDIIKTSALKYARLVNELWHQLEDLIPVCDSSTARIILGGHSASGQAALEAIQKGLFEFHPAAFVGFDPYRITATTMENKLLPASLPTLYWGFSDTTCFVQVNQAALGAYRLSSSHGGRVLYTIDNRNNRITHCVFTDKGCGMRVFTVCGTNKGFDWVYDSVAESIHRFVDALDARKDFSRDLFELPDAVGTIRVYVNDDDVKTKILDEESADETPKGIYTNKD